MRNKTALARTTGFQSTRWNSRWQKLASLDAASRRTSFAVFCLRLLLPAVSSFLSGSRFPGRVEGLAKAATVKKTFRMSQQPRRSIDFTGDDDGGGDGDASPGAASRRFLPRALPIRYPFHQNCLPLGAFIFLKYHNRMHSMVTKENQSLHQHHH